MRNDIMHMGRFVVAGLFTVVVLLGATSRTEAVTYPVTGLGLMDPNGTTTPLSVNNGRVVVGFATVNFLGYQVPHAFLWQNGVMTDLGTLELAYFAVARCINDANQVVGLSFYGQEHAWLWQNGVMTDLGTLSGNPNDLSGAFGINELGEVAGNSSTQAEPNVQHAFLWRNGTMTSLGSLGGGQSWAWDINDSTQIVGHSNNRAFLWEKGVMSSLGTLPGYTASSQALAINASGKVIGTSTDPNGLIHSFLWQNGTMTDLGTLPGRPSTVASAINNADLIVGASSDPNGDSRAFLWKQGAMYDLNTLVDPNSGWVLGAALGINDRGHIVGIGSRQGKSRGFIMQVYTLSLTVNGSNYGTVQVEPNLVFYEPNAAVTLRAIPNEGKGFFGWSGDVPAGHEFDNPLTVTMDSSKNIQATFRCGMGMGPMLPLSAVGLVVMYGWRRRGH